MYHTRAMIFNSTVVYLKHVELVTEAQHCEGTVHLMLILQKLQVSHVPGNLHLVLLHNYVPPKYRVSHYSCKF